MWPSELKGELRVARITVEDCLEHVANRFEFKHTYRLWIDMNFIRSNSV